MKRSFTLLELLMVVVIAAILAGIGIPIFFKAMERAKTNDAIGQVRILQSAERIYELDQGNSIDCANTAACNAALSLNLPGAEWDHVVAGTQVTATRGACVVTAVNFTADPAAGAGCP